MRMFIIVTSLLLAALATSAARAHAFLDRSSPLVGSTVPSAPRQLTMWFTRERTTFTGMRSRSTPIRPREASASLLAVERGLIWEAE